MPYILEAQFLGSGGTAIGDRKRWGGMEAVGRDSNRWGVIGSGGKGWEALGSDKTQWRVIGSGGE